MSPLSRRPGALLGALLALLLAGCGATGGDPGASGATGPAPAAVRPASPLQQRVEALGGKKPGRIEIPAGTYDLVAVPVEDASCAGCPAGKEATPVKATRGLLVTGRDVHLVGSAPGEVIIRTNAGMGIVFDHCEGCSLENVTVSGGRRDSDSNALDAAVVVRGGSVRIASCVLRDNLGNAVVVRATTAGLGGIIAAEGARLEVEDTRILRNSWNGVLLLRGATASIRGCVIDGVDRSAGDVVAGGRGVGISMAFDSTATIEGSLIARYWEGVNVQGSAAATIRRSVIEDIGTWGLAIQPGADGKARADVAETVFCRIGACGVLVRGSGEGTSLVDNILALTGQSPRPDERGLCVAPLDLPAGVVPAGTLGFANRSPGGPERAGDLDPAAFGPAIASVAEALRGTPATAGSGFLRDFGGLVPSPQAP